MTQVTANGNTYSDDGTTARDMRSGGFRTWLLAMLSDVMTVANNAIAAAATAVNSAGTSGTSTTSTAIGVGDKILTTQTAKNFVVGQPVTIARTSAPTTTYMTGRIKAYNSGTGAITVAVTFFFGSGTFTDWTISLAGLENQSVREMKQAPAIAAGVLAVDCATGNAFVTTLNANITSFTVTNIPATGALYGFMLELVADGTARTVTWTFQGVAVKWAGGVAPVLTSTAGKKDSFVFYTHDGGASWHGSVIGQVF